MVTPEQAYGTGLAINTEDQYDEPTEIDEFPWDLDTNNGDLKLAEGVENLHTCLAFFTAKDLSEHLGRISNVDSLADAQREIKSTLQADDRIEEVVEINSRFKTRTPPDESSYDEMAFEAVVIGTDDEQQELIFTL